MSLRIVQVQWIVNMKPTSIVSHPMNETCSLPSGRMWSVRAFHPPSCSIHEPAVSDKTEKLESTTDCTISGWPTFTQSAAIADEMVRKLMILPHVTSFFINKRPMFSTITGAASGTAKERLVKVRGCNRSNSTDPRLRIEITWRRFAFGRTSLKINTFLVRSPSRFNLSLINCEQTLWTWNEKKIKARRVALSTKTLSQTVLIYEPVAKSHLWCRRTTF